MHWTKRIKKENEELRKENETLRAELEKLRSDSQEVHGTFEVTDDNFSELVVSSKDPVVVDFYAEWCGPCVRLAPVLEELTREHSDTFLAGKLNIDENPRTTGRYGIRSLPTLIVFKNGQELGRIVGGMPKEFLEQRIFDIIQ